MNPIENQAKNITLQFIADSPRLRKEKPYRIRGLDLNPEDGIDITNLEWESHNVVVMDIRDSINKPAFEDCGFKWLDYKPCSTPSYDKESVIEYCDEMISLLHSQIDAEEILCYDLRLRKNRGINSIASGPFTDRELPDNPIEAVHTDHTKSIGWARIAHHLTPEEREIYFDGSYRLRIFNIWKPLNPIISDMPLAVCDSRSVKWADLIEGDQISPSFSAEVYYLRPSSEHQWYWMSNQTAAQPLLFLSWDSHPPSDNLNWCPHASFHDPDITKEAPPRESVEVRLIAFTKL